MKTSPRVFLVEPSQELLLVLLLVSLFSSQVHSFYGAGDNPRHPIQNLRGPAPAQVLPEEEWSATLAFSARPACCHLQVPLSTWRNSKMTRLKAINITAASRLRQPLPAQMVTDGTAGPSFMINDSILLRSWNIGRETAVVRALVPCKTNETIPGPWASPILIQSTISGSAVLFLTAAACFTRPRFSSVLFA